MTQQVALCEILGFQQVADLNFYLARNAIPVF